MADLGGYRSSFGCFGDTYSTTPNVDRLARRGCIYPNAWASAPVCAPARTAIITGVCPTSTGAEHMRSMSPMPAGWKLFPGYLRDAGYYCTNNGKEDYNLEKPEGTWDVSVDRIGGRGTAGRAGGNAAADQTPCPRQPTRHMDTGATGGRGSRFLPCSTTLQRMKARSSGALIIRTSFTIRPRPRWRPFSRTLRRYAAIGRNTTTSWLLKTLATRCA